MRLLALSLISIFSFILLIFGAQSVGKAQLAPEGISALHLTDCALPCWNGITLGKTQLGDAFRRIETEYGKASQTFFSDEALINTHYETNISTGTLELYLDGGGVVREVRLYFTDIEGVTLGDVASLFGTPSRRFGVPPNIVTFHCESASMIVSSSGTQGWHNPLQVFVIGYDDTGTQPCALEIK
jgi:hypothetical protein